MIQSTLVNPTLKDQETINWDKSQILIRYDEDGSIYTILATSGKHSEFQFEGTVLYSKVSQVLEKFPNWTKDYYVPLPKLSPITITFENK